MTLDDVEAAIERLRSLNARIADLRKARPSDPQSAAFWPSVEKERPLTAEREAIHEQLAAFATGPVDFSACDAALRAFETALATAAAGVAARRVALAAARATGLEHRLRSSSVVTPLYRERLIRAIRAFDTGADAFAYSHATVV